MTNQRSEDVEELISRTEIESKLDAHAVGALSHDETAWLRERIDMLERLLLDSEGEGKV